MVLGMHTAEWSYQSVTFANSEQTIVDAEKEIGKFFHPRTTWRLIRNMDTTTQISNRLTNQQLEDLFVTAYEVGSSYWCGISNEELKRARDGYKSDETLSPSEFLFAALLAGEEFEFYDQESDDNWTLTLDKIKEGTEKFALDCPEHYADALAESGDAETADAWFQVCLIGEITFG